MIYVLVQKNADGDYVVTKTYTSLSVTGVTTGISWGNISYLTLEQRLLDCIWIQNDVYVGTGEFMIFKSKDTAFDDVQGIVTNTYTYELMPLDDIKADMKSRVESKRDTLYYAGFTFNGNTYFSGLANRSNIQLMLLNALVDEANFPTDLVWDTTDGQRVSMDLPTFKQFAKALADFTRNLFITARSLKDAIDAATNYDDIRTAATWDGEAL